MEGTRNMGGDTGLNAQGKSAKEVDCIVADAGAHLQGAIAGTAISTGVLVPTVVNIPYIGWLYGWMGKFIRSNIGSKIGSQVNSLFDNC